MAFLLFCAPAELVAQNYPDIPVDTVPSKPRDSDPDMEKYLFNRKTPKIKPEIFRKYFACDIGMSCLSIPKHITQLDGIVPSAGLLAPLVSITFAAQKRPHCYFSQSLVLMSFAQTAFYGESFGGDPHLPGYTQVERTTVFSKFSFGGWTANLNLEFGKKFYWGTKFSGGLGFGGFYGRFWKHYYEKTTYGPVYVTDLTKVTNGTQKSGIAPAFYTGASCFAGYYFTDEFAVSLSALGNIWLLPHDQLLLNYGYARVDGWKDRIDPAFQVGVRYIFSTSN